MGAIRTLKKFGDTFQFQAALIGGHRLVSCSDKMPPLAMGIIGGLQALEIDILKKSFLKMRPNGANDRSFPSSHTAGAFLAFGFAWGTHGIHHPISRSFFISASLVGLSRYLSKKHWPSDVLVGAIIGSVQGYLAAHSTHIYKWTRKKNQGAGN